MLRILLLAVSLSLTLASFDVAVAQKAELRREIGRECRLVSEGRADLVTFPTRTRTNAAVPVEGILMKTDDGDPSPAIVVLHGGPGISPPNCYGGAQDYFVGLGYHVLVVDSYSAGFPDQGRDHRPSMEDRTRDAWAAARYLASRPDVAAARIGVVGWSLGGLATLLAVSDGMSPKHEAVPGFAAAIAIGPECVGSLRGLRTPLLLLHGEADRSNPVEDCRNMQVVGPAAPAFELVTYPGAGHTFDLPGSRDYHAPSARDSDKRMRAFFRTHLQAR